MHNTSKRVWELPAQWQERAARLRRWCLGEAPAQLITAVVCWFYGLSYLGWLGVYVVRIHPLPDIVTIPAWGWIWLTTGVVALVSAFIPVGMLPRLALVAFSGLMLLWGTSYFIEWAQGYWQRGGAGGTTHVMFPILLAWAVWRGHRAELTISRER